MKTVAITKPSHAVDLKDYANQITSHSDRITNLTNYMEFYDIKPQMGFFEDLVLIHVPDKYAKMITEKFNYCHTIDFTEDCQDDEIDGNLCEFNNEGFYEKLVNDFENCQKFNYFEDDEFYEIDDELDELLEIFDIE